MWFPSAQTWLIAWAVSAGLIVVVQVGVLWRLRTSPLIKTAPGWMTSLPMVAGVFMLYGIMSVCLAGYEVAEKQGASWLFLLVGAALGYRGVIAFRRKMVAHWLVVKPAITKADPQLVVNRLIVPYVRQYAQYCWEQGASHDQPLPSPLTVEPVSASGQAYAEPSHNHMQLALPNGKRFRIQLKGERGPEKLLLMLALSFGFSSHARPLQKGSIVWEMAGTSDKAQFPTFVFE